MTNIELFKLISKEYVGSKEIQEIVGCGINKAKEIRRDIEEECVKQKILLFNYKIPTKFLLKKIGIDIKKIHEKAKMEMELNEKKI